jgi:hypothetical protein
MGFSRNPEVEDSKEGNPKRTYVRAISNLLYLATQLRVHHEAPKELGNPQQLSSMYSKDLLALILMDA